MKNPILKSLLLCLLATSLTQAEVITVDNNPDTVAMFSNLQDAINAAESEDTILISGSPSHYGSVWTYKKLHFRGPGYFLAENSVEGISNQSATCQISFLEDPALGNALGSTASGLTMGIDTISPRASAFISECHIFRWSGTHSGGLAVARCYVSSNVSLRGGNQSIYNCYIAQNLTLSTQSSATRCVIGGGSASVSTDDTAIDNSIFLFDSDGNFNNNWKGSISNCMAIGASVLPSGFGNINAQQTLDVFVLGDSLDGKWRLKPNSPALGAGTNGGDLGLFAGANPYRLSGLPNLPRLTELTADAVATDANGLTFKVSAVAVGTTEE